MALKNNFYNEIINNEEKWTDLINRNLLTSIYCKFELKPFYVEKKTELETELKESDNLILTSMLLAIDNIIDKIDLFISQYENFEVVDFKTLLPLFLNNQMNNSNENKKNKIEALKQQRSELKNMVDEYKKIKSQADNDYVYDNFYEEEPKKIA